jgi:hypothetical protein
MVSQRLDFPCVCLCVKTGRVCGGGVEGQFDTAWAVLGTFIVLLWTLARSESDVSSCARVYVRVCKFRARAHACPRRVAGLACVCMRASATTARQCANQA